MKIFLVILVSSAILSFGATAPLSPTLVAKLLSVLNSVKAALPNAGAAGKDGKGDSGSEKKGGQPTHFHMDDRSPEIEVKTSDQGIDVKARPASLQVESIPEEIKHFHEEAHIEHVPVIGNMPQLFMAPPEVVHPIQPVYYGGDIYHDHHPHFRHYHNHIHRPYYWYPYRHFYRHHYDDYFPGHDDEDGYKKGRIPIAKNKRRKKSKKGKTFN